MLQILHSINLNEYNINLNPPISINKRDTYSFKLDYDNVLNLFVLVFYINKIENFNVYLDKPIITVRTS